MRGGKKTVTEYKRYAERDLGPALGAIPLSALTPRRRRWWVNDMQDEGAAGGTIQNKHGFLSGALKVAVKDGHLAANPCEGVRLPRTEQKEMVFLTGPEFRTLKAAFSAHYGPFFVELQSRRDAELAKRWRLGRATLTYRPAPCGSPAPGTVADLTAITLRRRRRRSRSGLSMCLNPF